MERKMDESAVPYGEYCYEIEGVESSKSGTKIRTRRCPYFVFKDVDADSKWKEPFCLLLNDTFWQLDEQVKMCGKNLTKSIDDISETPENFS